MKIYGLSRSRDKKGAVVKQVYEDGDNDTGAE